MTATAPALHPDLGDLAERLLQAATRAGADAADAIALSGQSLSIDLRQGKLEQAERAEGSEIGLRVLVGGRQACVAASDLSDRTIQTLAERAVAMAREAPDDPTAGLADPGQLIGAYDLGPLELAEAADLPEADALLSAARQMEEAALSREGITQVEASAGASRRTIHLAATNGFRAGYARSSHSLSAVAFTGHGTGMERDWAAEGRVHRADLPDAQAIGALAAARAMDRRDARRPVTGTYPVVYDERVASSLIGHLLGAINGQSIARGSSFLRDRMGQRILPEGLSLIEDPHRPRQGSSRLFDAEGLPTARRAFVEDGILASWVLDLASARKLGLTSTANAARGPASPPGPSTSNIALTQGTRSRADLLADMGRGLLVTSMIGSTINPNTGDYSRGAAGFWVENGQIQYPVNECTIAGNLIGMLARLVPANDARTHLSMVVPSLLVDGMTLAGS